MTGLFLLQEARQLLDAFADSIRELVKLHEDQVQAIISGDPDSTRLTI